MSPMGEALATDTRLYALFVDRWREQGERPLGLNWLAWHWDDGAMGEAKVAITMKAAEGQGLVVRDRNPTPDPPFVVGGQTAWTPTAELLEMFPEGAQVMPEEIEVGGFKSVSGKEAQTWGPDRGDVPLPPARPRRRPGLVKSDAPFKGYLGAGDDADE
ncbi:MAG: hypothetical protein ABW167_00970 [Baekduia sp.]